MITAAEILKRADEFVKLRDQWAAFPSTDVGIAAVTEILVAAVNAEVGKFAAGVLEVLALVPSAISGETEVASYNYAIAELAKLIGEAA